MIRSNPFPGMNPWLEGGTVWPTVHTALIGYLWDELGRILPDGLVARAEEAVTLSEGTFRSDVAIREDSWKSGETPVWLPGDEPSANVPVHITVEEIVERWIEVRTLEEVYPVSVRDRLPIIWIPLREDDDDLRIDLQRLVDRVYETGRYWITDYLAPPSPTLRESDASWARERLGG